MKYRRTVISQSALREILADPIVQAVMFRDGVTERDVAGVVRQARRCLAGDSGVFQARAAIGPVPLTLVDDSLRNVGAQGTRSLPWNR